MPRATSLYEYFLHESSNRIIKNLVSTFLSQKRNNFSSSNPVVENLTRGDNLVSIPLRIVEYNKHAKVYAHSLFHNMYFSSNFPVSHALDPPRRLPNKRDCQKYRFASRSRPIEETMKRSRVFDSLFFRGKAKRGKETFVPLEEMHHNVRR